MRKIIHYCCSLFLHQYAPKTKAFHPKRDQGVFEQIVVVFVHDECINVDELYYSLSRKNNFLCLFCYI